MQYFTHLSVFVYLLQHSIAEGFGEESHHADFKNKVSSRWLELSWVIYFSLSRLPKNNCSSAHACAFLGGPVYLAQQTVSIQGLIPGLYLKGLFALRADAVQTSKIILGALQVKNQYSFALFLLLIQLAFCNCTTFANWKTNNRFYFQVSYCLDVLFFTLVQ